MSIAALDRLSPEDVAARLRCPDARVALIRDGAMAGVAEAQAVWGQMLLDDGDPVSALGWFTRAAAQHHLMALNMVGRCYDLGWGAPIDKARAAACYRIAAERGQVEAMYNHATLLTLGEGVGQDRAAALALFERAAAAGYAKAANYVGSFAEDGWVHPRDMMRAMACYRMAAEGGDFRGAFNLARLLGDEGRVDEAITWIARVRDWGTSAFVAKAQGWLARSPIARFRTEGVAALC
jgi:hypothetical protein